MKRKFYIETYGCQMNFSDSEIISSILIDNEFEQSESPERADVIFVNTCSIRDHAEQRIKNRLKQFRHLKRKNPALLIGVLGCMAERMKDKLLEEENYIDMIVGPDAYRDLPKLMQIAEAGNKAINVILSADETYADISPVRIGSNGVTAFISIMRGCENFCSYCVVPSTRGVERSRNPESIYNEAVTLFQSGYREITLLGQNVNSYSWKEGSMHIDFPDLLQRIASIDSLLRLRFATSHPKDLSDKLLHTIARYPNICRSIHLPVQSGSSRILKLMNRSYDAEWYKGRIEAIRRIIPGCGISTDIIAGFCSETEEDHQETLKIMEWAKFDFAYMFKYSERPGTIAEKLYADDVPDEVKSRRLKEIIELQQHLSLESNRLDIGKEFSVLVEGHSKRSKNQWMGRTSQNKVVVFRSRTAAVGKYHDVIIRSCTAATLLGEELNHQH